MFQVSGFKFQGSGFDGADVLDGYFREDVVSLAHFHFQDDIGGVLYSRQFPFESYQRAAHDFDLLSQGEILGGDHHRVGGVVEDIPQLLHFSVSDIREDPLPLFPVGGRPVNHETVNAGVFQKDIPKIVFRGADKNFAWDDNLLDLPAVPACVNLGLFHTRHIDIVPFFE